MTVTFFGHRNIFKNVKPILEKTIRNLIENEKADLFYVGSNGDFDEYVASTLETMRAEYPHIKCYIVLVYMPSKQNSSYWKMKLDTIFPEDVAISIPRFAIAKRNDWMLSKSDIVVTYISHPLGCAEKYHQKAIKKEKKVINLAEIKEL